MKTKMSKEEIEARIKSYEKDLIDLKEKQQKLPNEVFKLIIESLKRREDSLIEAISKLKEIKNEN